MAQPSGVNERPIIIVKKIKKVAGGHHGGAWKVAYADFVTAMMAFFMLLWLLANPDKERLRGLAEYFTPAPPSTSSMSGMSPGDTRGQGGRTRRAQADNTTSLGQPSMEAATAGTARGGTASIPDSSMRVLAQELRVALDAQQQENRESVAVQPTREGVRVSLMDTDNRSMFRSGTAELNGYGRSILSTIAGRIARAGVQIAIEGHTDAAGQADANWRLSGDRAHAARAALVASGVPQDRFTEVVALGSSRPVYPDQPERPENRRITVVLLAEPSALPSDVSFRF
ncbi:flagellar motor protein MotB [Novosphingobium sp. M1R2S20]|uniref:Flagellar motor protein MotB n=1 Tax=Novosphingobium rhizovicinum TaxID=3228928 RepID=A0ABV3R9L5_9SPHN